MAVIQKAWLASASTQLEADFPSVLRGTAEGLEAANIKGSIRRHMPRKRLLPAPATPLPPMACLYFSCLAASKARLGKLRSLARPCFHAHVLPS